MYWAEKHLVMQKTLNTEVDGIEQQNTTSNGNMMLTETGSSS